MGARGGLPGWGRRGLRRLIPQYPVVVGIGDVQIAGKFLPRYTNGIVEPSERRHRLGVRVWRQFHHPIVATIGDVDGAVDVHRDTGGPLKASEGQHHGGPRSRSGLRGRPGLGAPVVAAVAVVFAVALLPGSVPVALAPGGGGGFTPAGRGRRNHQNDRDDAGEMWDEMTH